MYQALPMFQRVGAAALKNDLSNTIRLCEDLGNPQLKFKSVHVAGTNGKGSSSHMIAAIMQAAGYKTGLYTSPHLKEFTERIRIDGREVDQHFIVDFVNRVKASIELIKPSFFELTVAMAFDYFARQEVDIAIIEVGLGGRLDSTNVILPEVSLITNISFDHMDLLGDTLEKIASEKAGIIKSKIPVVISEMQEEVKSVFTEKAKALDAPIQFANDHIHLRTGSDGLTAFHSGKRWLKHVHPQLRGDYQRKNIPGVLYIILTLREKGFKVPDESIRKGIEQVVTITGLKGRWQKLGESPLIICDTGHNSGGIREVVNQIRLTKHDHLHFVLGMVKEKDITHVLDLLPRDATYYFCQAKIPRALEAGLLAASAKEAGLQGQIIPDVNEAVRTAVKAAQHNDMVFIGGSTFVVAEVDGL